MPSCFCCCRSRNQNSKIANISFHKFPAKENIKAKWFNFVNDNGLNTADITKNSLICSAHFDPECFIFNQNQNMSILKKTAVPTCTVARVKNPKNVYSELVKPLLLDVSNSNEPSTSNCILFERTEVKLSPNDSNADEAMNISLISVDAQETQKNENVNVQKSVSPVKSANDDDDDDDAIASFLLVDTPSTLPSMDIESTSDTFIIKKPCTKRKISLMAASKINSSDTPRRRFLKHGIRSLTDELAIKNLKLKSVQQTVRRMKKKIATLKEIIEKLQKENLINEDVGYTLLESFGDDEQ